MIHASHLCHTRSETEHYYALINNNASSFKSRKSQQHKDAGKGTRIAYNKQTTHLNLTAKVKKQADDFQEHFQQQQKNDITLLINSI